jgi:hypothetical protein
MIADPAGSATPPAARATLITEAVITGMLVMLAGSMPRNILFAANLRYYTAVPWAVPALAIYLWFGRGGTAVIARTGGDHGAGLVVKSTRSNPLVSVQRMRLICIGAIAPSRCT